MTSSVTQTEVRRTSGVYEFKVLRAIREAEQRGAHKISERELIVLAGLNRMHACTAREIVSAVLRRERIALEVLRVDRHSWQREGDLAD